MIIITKYNYLFFNHNNNIYSIKNSIPQEPNDKGDALVSKVSYIVQYINLQQGKR